MKKLKIDSTEFDSILTEEKKETTPAVAAMPAKNNTGEALDVSVKISRKNKLALQDMLRKKEKETGKFTALNRYIDDILTEYIKRH